MSNNMADVTIHIDETIDAEARERIQDELCGMSGVMAASSHEEKPHLVVVEYDPERINSHRLLDTVTASGVHAQLIGL